MNKLKINQHEVNNAINTIQEFIRIIVNGLEVVQDELGIYSVRIVNYETKQVIRELDAEELIAVVTSCKALMKLTKHDM